MRSGDDDDELVDRLQRQDERAQLHFWNRYRGLVYRTALFQARHRSTHDAEEIAQEVFCRAFRSIKTFERKVSLKVWLIRLCHNAATDFYRPSRFRRESTDSAQVQAASEKAAELAAPTDVPEPLRAYLERERDDLLRAAIANLDPIQRAVVEHRAFAGLSVAETAELLGKTEGAVKMLFMRALASLAACDELAEPDASQVHGGGEP